MTPRPSHVRKKFATDHAAIGSWIISGSPMAAEMMAGAGFDFLCVDVEHSAVDLPQCQQLFQAITSGNPECDAFVRVHGVDYAHVKRYLDAGANGIVAPFVRTREDAELLIEAVKYPPHGRRGVGFCRANNYGRDLESVFAQANASTTVVVQIEHIDSVRNLDAILAVPGIDAAFIGPFDLTASMGIPARFDHPDYLAVRRQILERCQLYGVAPGLHVIRPDPDAVEAAIVEGFRFIAYSLDLTMLADCCTRGLGTIHAATARL
jgi:2-dehydro-3-deoxyglucarate aldolase